MEQTKASGLPFGPPKRHLKSERRHQVDITYSLQRSRNCSNANDQESPAPTPVSSRTTQPQPPPALLPQSRVCTKDIGCLPPVPAPRKHLKYENSDKVENKSSLTGSRNCANVNNQTSGTTPLSSPAFSPMTSRAASSQPPSALLPLSYSCSNCTKSRRPMPAPRRCNKYTSSRRPMPTPSTLPVSQRLKSEHDAGKYKNPGIKEETIPDGSQRSDGLSDDVADVPILIGNPNEEVKPRQRVPSESDINSTTDEEDYDDDEFSDWDVDPFDSDDSFALDSLDNGQGIRQKSRLKQIVTEVHSTEKEYVMRLGLLFLLQSLVVAENQKSRMFPDDIIPQMFSNMNIIYRFHHDFLMPELQQILTEWDYIQKLGHVMKRFAPFLKLTSEYVTNIDHARDVITQWKKNSTKFASIISSFEENPACQNLTLFDHMLEPVQRLPRYELLLKEYLKYLPEDSSDKKDAEETLQLVTNAAKHPDEEIRRRENVEKTRNITKSFAGSAIHNVITPESEVIKKGPIGKISARKGKSQTRYLFLLNDALVVAVSKYSKYRLAGRLSLEGMQILEDEDLEIPNSFVVKSKQKVIQLLAKSPEEKVEWQEAINDAIAGCSHILPICTQTENLGTQAPSWTKDQKAPKCMQCSAGFTPIFRRHHCRACGHVVCGNCSSHKVLLSYNDQMNRVCDKCYNTLLQGGSAKTKLTCGFLHISTDTKRWQKQYFVVYNDFVLRSFKDAEDSSVMTFMPLSGYTVSEACANTRRYVFKLFRVGQKDVYYFQAENQCDLIRWTSGLEMAIKGKVILYGDSNQNNTLEDSD